MSASSSPVHGQQLLDLSPYIVLGAATFNMGMGVGAFTKAGKGKRASAKAGFALTGLFFMGATALLVYVGIQLLTKDDEKKP